ncbi:polysaccharide export protein [bacterium]|nr:polysaccharide export protein [bacterium]
MNDGRAVVRRVFGWWHLSVVVVGVLAFSLLAVGCATRSITKPRSLIIEEAEDQGVSVPSIAEDRARFYEWEDRNRDRLLALIQNRLTGVPLDPSYRLGPGDELEIRVFDVEELNTTVRVSQSGFIDLPLVGAVETKGLTSAQLEEALRRRLRRFVRNPQASVFLTHYASQEVAVIGAVEKPARYPLRKGNNSLLEVLTLAGGVSDTAGSTVNLVPVEFTGVPAAQSPEERAKFALKASTALQSKGAVSADNSLEISLQDVYGTSGGIPLEIPIRGGDMIIVPEAGKVLVEGEVEKRGAFELGQRSTLLGALAAAGGITYSAKIDEVELVRPTRTGDRLRLVVNLEEILSGAQKDISVRNGDLVRVPSHSGRRMREDTFNGITRILNFGVGGSVNVMN